MSSSTGLAVADFDLSRREQGLFLVSVVRNGRQGGRVSNNSGNASDDFPGSGSPNTGCSFWTVLPAPFSENHVQDTSSMRSGRCRHRLTCGLFHRSSQMPSLICMDVVEFRSSDPNGFRFPYEPQGVHCRSYPHISSRIDSRTRCRIRIDLDQFIRSELKGPLVSPPRSQWT